MGQHLGDVDAQALTFLEDEQAASLGSDRLGLVRASNCGQSTLACQNQREGSLTVTGVTKVTRQLPPY